MPPFLASDFRTAPTERASGAAPVNIMLSQGQTYMVVTTSVSQDVQLSPRAKGISVYSKNNDAFFSIGNGPQEVDVSLAYIGANERLAFDVTGYGDPHIAILVGDAATPARVFITELV